MDQSRDKIHTPLKINAIPPGYLPQENAISHNKVQPIETIHSNIFNTPRNLKDQSKSRMISPVNVLVNSSNRQTVDNEARVFTSPHEVSRMKLTNSRSIPNDVRFSALQKKILIGSIALFSVIVILAAAIVPPVYVLVIRQNPTQSSFTNVTTSTCPISTCIGQETPYHSSMVTVLYPFDGNINDAGGTMPGIFYGAALPSFTFNGYVSQALYLSPGNQQYVQITSVDLSKKSFTIQMWIMISSTLNSTVYGIFGQCDSYLVCLSINLQSGRFVFALDSMNSNGLPLFSSRYIIQNAWYHVAFVYDATLLQQRIYIDGNLDAISTGIVNAYQGVTSSSVTTIGRSSSITYGTTYYYARIDHFTISAGVARSACQIYNDASLVVYYPFDASATYNDYGVNYCNGIASGIASLSSGRFNQAISFTSNTSYFVCQCFPRVRSFSNSFFSISLWINPKSIAGGTILHISSTMNGNGTCYDALVLTGNGTLLCQWLSGTLSVTSIQGPAITANTWTHIAAVYNNAEDLSLFVNGTLAATSSYGVYINLFSSSVPYYMILGNVGTSSIPLSSSECINGTIASASGSFSGAIDEFRLYNRLLTSAEICVLSGR